MATTEAARNQLYNRLVDVLGADSAETLMASLPPIPVGDLATKSDLAVLRGDLEDLRGEFKGLRGEFKDLRGEFKDLRGEFKDLRGEFNDLRTEVKADLAAVNQRLDIELGAIHQRLDRAFITQIVTLVSVVAAVFAGNALF